MPSTPRLSLPPSEKDSTKEALSVIMEDILAMRRDVSGVNEEISSLDKRLSNVERGKSESSCAMSSSERLDSVELPLGLTVLS